MRRLRLPITIILLSFSVCGSALRAQSVDQTATESKPALAVESTAAPIPPFPTLGILPKSETGALRFLAEHPEYDGRGVVVAIFDTGVDPGAPGLQVTSDGKPKIIDMVDGTGSGDVDTSTIRTPEGHQLEGLSGRTLKLDPSWENPTGEYHIGLKRGYDFFPARLVTRLKRERRKDWMIPHRQAEAALRRKLLSWDAEHPHPTAAERLEREELETRLEQLQFAERHYEDPGPIYDCVVFHDGQDWRVAIDTDENGDLTDEKLLTNFRKEQQYGTFQHGSELNFAVNIYDKGRRLSIVADCGAHGTHVAGIVAGHFPDQPELNGVAPGAQIVSIKIGDSRLGSMETGAGLVRGLIAALENQCDLINMSYGEPTGTPNRGRLPELFSEMVDKRGLIFVASAGNRGPALSTVGAPGGTTSSILGVGAYISPQMMSAEYILRERLPEMPYTWTSRGPTSDGAIGVDIFAPGGAIAPVPNWTLQRNMQMNGTSMASPNACGNIALLLSALKVNEVEYSPESVRRALENTARPIEGCERFAQGAGLVQVDRAFKYLQDLAGCTGERLRFQVDVPSRNKARGIYLREPYETNQVAEETVRIRPIFPESARNGSKVDFEMRIELESTQPWVTTGDYVLLMNGGRSFQVCIDATGLKHGVHFAEVLGYDAGNRNRGPMFRVPITVVRSEKVECCHTRSPTCSKHERVRFSPGQIERRFIAVPAEATWADFRLRLQSNGTQRRFVIQAVQLLNGQSFRKTQTYDSVTLQPGLEVVRSFPVEAGHTLELCLAQYWSSLGSSEVQFELTFHGIVPNRRNLTLTVDEPVVKLEVTNRLQPEQIAPQVVLETHRQLLRPIESQITPLSAPRDLLPDGRQLYQLVLTYVFEQTQPGRITPHFPQTDGLLYDSEYGAQLWMLFDSAKRRVATDDVWPEPVKIGKGTHTLRLQLRHSDVKKLEPLQDMVLLLDRPLENSISLQVYDSARAARTKGEEFASKILQPGCLMPIYLVHPLSEDLPTMVRPGDHLVGTITYGKARSMNGAGRRPGGFPIRIMIPPVAEEPQEESSATSNDSPVNERLVQELIDFKVEQLKAIPFETECGAFNALAAEILEARPDHLPVLVTRLHRLDDVKHRKERLPQIVAAADDVIAQIDRGQLALGCAMKSDLGGGGPERKKIKKLHAILVDALYRKGRALGYMELPDVLAKYPIADPEAHDAAFEANFTELQNWVDTTDAEYVLLHVRRERRKQRYGHALKLLNSQIAESAPRYWYYKKRRDIYKELGWDHLWEQEARWLVIRFPRAFEPF